MPSSSAENPYCFVSFTGDILVSQSAHYLPAPSAGTNVEMPYDAFRRQAHTDEFFYFAFMPVRPVYSGPLLGCLSEENVKFEAVTTGSSIMYRLEKTLLYQWQALNNTIRVISKSLFSLVQIVPLDMRVPWDPVHFGYDKLHENMDKAKRAVRISRAAFTAQLSLISFYIAATAYNRPTVAIWTTLTDQYNIPLEAAGAIRRSWVADFSVPRIGIFVNLQHVLAQKSDIGCQWWQYIPMIMSHGKSIPLWFHYGSWVNMEMLYKNRARLPEYARAWFPHRKASEIAIHHLSQLKHAGHTGYVRYTMFGSSLIFTLHWAVKSSSGATRWHLSFLTPSTEKLLPSAPSLLTLPPPPISAGLSPSPFPPASSPLSLPLHSPLPPSLSALQYPPASTISPPLLGLSPSPPPRVAPGSPIPPPPPVASESSILPPPPVAAQSSIPPPLPVAAQSAIPPLPPIAAQSLIPPPLPIAPQSAIPPPPPVLLPLTVSSATSTTLAPSVLTVAQHLYAVKANFWLHGQLPMESFEDFLARRKLEHEQLEKKENTGLRQRRLALMKKYKNQPLPARTTVVYEWQWREGFLVRRIAGRRNVIDLWARTVPSQRVYDPFYDEYDICVASDPHEEAQYSDFKDLDYEVLPLRRAADTIEFDTLQTAAESFAAQMSVFVPLKVIGEAPPTILQSLQLCYGMVDVRGWQPVLTSGATTAEVYMQHPERLFTTLVSCSTDVSIPQDMLPAVADFVAHIFAGKLPPAPLIDWPQVALELKRQIQLSPAIDNHGDNWLVFTWRNPASSHLPFRLAVRSILTALRGCRQGIYIDNRTAVVEFIQCGVPLRTLAPLCMPTQPDLMPDQSSAVPVDELPVGLGIRSHSCRPTVADYTAYEQVRNDLLARPGVGRAALMRGGILWRLARDVVSVDQVLAGPDVADERYQCKVSGEDWPYVDDQLSVADEMVLVGMYRIETSK